MAEIFQSPTMLRSFICYEFFRGKPIWEAYKNFCHSMGDETMDYIEFEFWYIRFTNGNFDLNYDRSSDPKSRLLSDMPIHIVVKIVNKLELMDRFIIRDVSKNFQFIIDSWNPGFKKIGVHICDSWTRLRFDDKWVSYSDDDSRLKMGCCLMESDNGKTIIESEKPVTLAFRHLAIVLKNPNLQLAGFHVNYSHGDKHFKEFESMLKSLNRKLHARTATFYSKCLHNESFETRILPLLKDGPLQTIFLNTFDKGKLKMDQILGLEQCKKADMVAQKVHINSASFPIKCFLELRRFIIEFEKKIEQTTLLRFTRILLKSNVLNFALLKTSASWISIPAFLKQLRRHRSIEVPGRPHVRRLPIPKSNEFFEIEIYNRAIYIERKF